MEQVEALRRILPPLGEGEAYCCFARRKAGGNKQVMVATPGDVLEFGRAWREEAEPASFAPCSFGRDGGRKASEARKARSLFLDVECKDDSKYKTQAEGRAALESFIWNAGVPAPLVVSSGRGLHVYWTLSETLDVPVWRKLSAALMRTADKLGLEYDRHRTADPTTVLRIPGTINWKNGAEVTVLDLGETSDVLSLAERLLALGGAAPSRPAKATRSGELLDPAILLEHCAQLEAAGDTVATRLSWYFMINVMSFCEGGLEEAHKISKLAAARYDAAEVDRQFDKALGFGPVKCSTFMREDPVSCEGCAWSGRVSTPIQIPGRLKASDGSGLVPFKNWEFEVVPGRGLYQLQAAPPDAPNDRPRVLINENEFYINAVQVSSDDRRERRHVEFKVRGPGSSFSAALFSIDEDFGPQPMERWLANNGLSPVDGGHQRTMERFVKAYIASLQNKLDLVIRALHFGWTDYVDKRTGGRRTGFVYRDVMRGPGVSQPVALDDRCAGMVESHFAKAGTLEEWKKIPAMYGLLDQKEAQLFVCSSFAAPLMTHGVGVAKNIVLALWDGEGGKGKTTVLRVSNSVWGHPDRMMSGKTDSKAARYQRLGVWKNLPFNIDECTNMDDEKLSDLMFDLSSGRESSKSNPTGTDLRRQLYWETVTGLTSNRSVYEILQERSSQITAERMRLIEVECGFRSYTGTPEGDLIEDRIFLLDGNYGLAGEVFLSRLFEDPGVFERAAAKVRRWDKSRRLEASERFWTGGLGMILEAGRLAVGMGLLDYDMDALEGWVTKTLLPGLRERVRGRSQAGGASILADYLYDNLDSMLVVAGSGVGDASTVPPAFDSYVKRSPNRTLQTRLELDTRRLYVGVREFGSWCVRQRLSVDLVLRGLAASNIWSPTNGKTTYNLARGVPSLGGAPKTCYIFSGAVCEALAEEYSEDPDDNPLDED
jgi:hypothetical protein